MLELFVEVGHIVRDLAEARAESQRPFRLELAQLAA